MRCLALAFLLACSSTTPARTSQPPPSQPPVSGAKAEQALIEVAPLTVTFGGHPIARLHADGRTESVGAGTPGPNAELVPGPTLHADGRIELEGGFAARVEPDGDIVVVPPPTTGQAEQRFGQLVGEVLQTSPNSGVRLEGGKLVMFYDGKPTNEIGVIDPPRLGRTALIMTAAFIMASAITSN